MDETQIKHVLEAALLAAGRPLPLEKLASLFATKASELDKATLLNALEALASDYKERGLELKEVSSGYRIQIKRSMSDWLTPLWEERAPRYTRALLETLALVAYRQPITRAEIEEVRGVAVSTNIMRTLLERNWVRVVGHRDVPGKPAMFGTTKDFLDYFGLKRLEDLPALADVKDGLPELSPQVDLIEALDVDDDGEGDVGGDRSSDVDGDGDGEHGGSGDAEQAGSAEVQVVIAHASAMDDDAESAAMDDDAESADVDADAERADVDSDAEAQPDNSRRAGADGEAETEADDDPDGVAATGTYGDPEAGPGDHPKADTDRADGAADKALLAQPASADDAFAVEQQHDGDDAFAVEQQDDVIDALAAEPQDDGDDALVAEPQDDGDDALVAEPQDDAVDAFAGELQSGADDAFDGENTTGFDGDPVQTEEADVAPDEAADEERPTKASAALRRFESS